MPVSAGSDSPMDLEIAGERVQLDPEFGLYWPAGGVLFVADPHFGKEASARAIGVPVPDGGSSETLGRIDRLVRRHRPKTVVFLGDVFDSRAARGSAVIASLAAWRRSIPSVRVEMVIGNHDAGSDDLAASAGMRLLGARAVVGPWEIRHHPPDELQELHVLCGHVHPGVSLDAGARQRMRLPCFLVGAHRTILPAIGALTGLATVRPGRTETAYAIAGDRILSSRASFDP